MSGDGGPGDAGASFDDPEPETPSYDPDTFSGIGVDDGSMMDPEGYEGQSGFTASGAPGMGQGIGPSPDAGEPMGFSEAMEIGLNKAVEKDPTMMGLSAIVPGMGILGLAAALDNAPPGSLAASPGDDPGEGPEGGPEGPPEPVVTPLPEIVSAGETEPPLIKTPATDTGVTTAPAAEEPAGPTVSPKAASAAPGTLLRRRRRTRTILTSPQGVVGPAVPARRTRSLPRKTLLGG